MNFGGIRFIISRSSHSAQEIRPFITEEERDGNTLALPKLPNGSPERANKINAKIICFIVRVWQRCHEFYLLLFRSLFLLARQQGQDKGRQGQSTIQRERGGIGEGARDTCSYQIRVGCESDLKKVPQPANWINSVATCACQMWHFLPPYTRYAPTKNVIFIGGQTPKHCDMTNAPLNPPIPPPTHTPRI